jgi:hypothetical protein
MFHIYQLEIISFQRFQNQDEIELIFDNRKPLIVAESVEKPRDNRSQKNDLAEYPVLETF